MSSSVVENIIPEHRVDREGVNAHLRTFMGIPYAPAIAKVCGAKEIFHRVAGQNTSDALSPLPRMEIGYRAITALLDGQWVQYRHILMLGAGLSPRGLHLSRNRSDRFFIEIDTVPMIVQKIEIAQRMISHQNIGWLGARVTDAEEFCWVEAAFPPGPIVITSEGFFSQLVRGEIMVVGRHVHALLKKRGGVWITSDTSPYELAHASYSPEDARGLLEGVGFTLHEYNPHSLVSLGELQSPHSLNISDEKCDGAWLDSKIWTLEVRQ